MSQADSVGRKRLAVLGSTGSIGVTTLDIAARFPDRFEVCALAGGRNVERLAEQVRRFQPALAAAASMEAVRELRARVPEWKGEAVWGPEGLAQVAGDTGAHLVVSGLVGAMGLVPTLRALARGVDVALANKEALVVAGEIVRRTAAETGATLLPIDSEHNAVFQALQGHRRDQLRRIILTASGGPFREVPAERLRFVTVEQALAHPTWKMGNKITIDSATLMNKGLEVIEAHWLFSLPPERIDVLVHPQSIVHSLVEYVDGSVLAQLGVPDMAIPISYILGYPERLPMEHLPTLDLAAAGRLDFFPPDLEKFPCLRLAYDALAAGGTAPAVLNAANELAVAAFLAGRIGFLDIPMVVEQVLSSQPVRPADDLETVLDADRRARAAAERAIFGCERGRRSSTSFSGEGDARRNAPAAGGGDQ